jgi:endonuclease/exonuclease/phosphatase family metal-dependent hydrolase
VWAFNRRAERFEPPRSGMALEAVNLLSDWLEGDRCAVVGDFNNSVIWDKKQKSNNFQDIAERLTLLGLESAYHRFTNEAFGKESARTHYWRKSEATRYHIDYCFAHHSLEVAEVKVPAFEAWRSLSDHVPVITDTFT